jgi:hypothetical protein
MFGKLLFWLSDRESGSAGDTFGSGFQPIVADYLFRSFRTSPPSVG